MTSASTTRRRPPAALLLALLAAAGPAPAGGFEQGRCGQTVTRSVVLTEDLVDCPGDGIRIGADGVAVDCGGHLIAGTGSGRGIVVTDLHRATVRNCLVRGFDRGIDLSASRPETAAKGSTGHRIAGNTLTGNRHGVFLAWTHETTIASNRVDGNADSGITLAGSDDLHGPCSDRNNIEGNVIGHNRRGLVTWCPYQPQQGNRCRGNTFAHNAVAVTAAFQDRARIDYRGNTFRDNLHTPFFALAGNHRLEAGRPRDFDIALYQGDGSPCRHFTVGSVASSPPEEVRHGRSDNRVRGSFTPRRKGLYSLELEVRGCGQEAMSQRFWLGREEATTLVLARGERNDVGRLVLIPPAEPVRVHCTMWIEAPVHEPPAVTGIAKLTRVRTSLWSDYVAQGDLGLRNLYGLELDRTFSRRADVLVGVDGKYRTGRIRVTETLQGGPFLLDRADWLGLAVKYIGRDPVWISTPEQLSTVTLDYLVTDAPVVETLSRRDVWLLSATAPADAAGGAELVLAGRGPTTLAVRLPEPERPYRVALDGRECGRDAACSFRRDGARVHVDLELDSLHRLTIVAGAADEADGDVSPEG
jgi:parallel beta-helix repeat protein